MGLSKYTPPKLHVEVPGLDDGIDVRGLTPTDLSGIIRECWPEVDRLYDLATKGHIDGATPETLALTLGDKAPELMARVIAFAADEPTLWEVARTLPADVQQDALVKIFQLSFQREGTPEKFLAVVANTLSTTTALYQKLQGYLSQTGFKV